MTLENEPLDEGIGRAIQQRHGGDNVFDLARVLRLPGTINILSPEKQTQGRKPAVVEIEYGLSGGNRYTIEQMKAAFPPLLPPPGKKDEKRPDIDMGAVYQTQIDGKLPNDIQKRFDAARSQHRRLSLLWDGAVAPGDGSPSAFEFELVGWLKQFGFTPTECAQIVSGWNHQSVKHADELERRIRNCWTNNPAPVGGEWCEPYEADGPVSFESVLSREVPPVEELIPGLIEKGTVTFLSAPGGKHKSRLALQWGLSISAGVPVFDRPVERATFVYVSCEDHRDEVTRRVQAISRRLKLPTVDIGQYWDRVNKDSPLAVVHESGDCELKPFWTRLRDCLRTIEGHKFVVLDGTYNVLRFAGQAKINETSVMSGIGLLQRLCGETDSTILTLWHPSQSGQERGDASGWSVAWHNAPRARLSLKSGTDSDGSAQGDDALTLTVEKRNHGAKGAPIKLYWSDGTLLPRSQVTEIDIEAKLQESVVRVATKAAEMGLPMTIQRRPQRWQIDEIESDTGWRPSSKDVKDALGRALSEYSLQYIRGSKDKAAGYYPADHTRANELAREAKRNREHTRDDDNE